MSVDDEDDDEDGESGESDDDALLLRQHDVQLQHDMQQRMLLMPSDDDGDDDADQGSRLTMHDVNRAAVSEGTQVLPERLLKLQQLLLLHLNQCETAWS